MSNRVIVGLKVVAHGLLLLPFVHLLMMYRDGSLALLADPVNFITHRTGSWALWILLGDLAITPLRRLSVKLSWLIRFRRMVGLYAFFYATLHLMTYVFLFSGYDVPTAIAGLRARHLMEPVRQFEVVWPTMVDDVEKRKFVQVGLAAWLMLLALAVTSPQRVMRTMGGKRWQWVHRLIYLAAIAAAVHFWWLVKAGVRSPLRVTVVLGVLLGARMVYAGMKRWKESRKVTFETA
ncbi:MAG: protein-methionine-sulfoxide reductase heme-binding subunit MsrQ [Acidobacteriota bacterium]